eukprot:7784962-Pyramimonas_sp.AAC.1
MRLQQVPRSSRPNLQLRADSRMHAQEIAKDVSSEWSKRDHLQAFRRLRSIGAGSKKTVRRRVLPILNGFDENPLDSERAVAD